MTTCQQLVSETSQLNMELEIGHGGFLHHLGNHLLKSLPGQPRVRLEEPELGEYLTSQLRVPELDSLAERLWLVSRILQVLEDLYRPSPICLFT